MSERGSFVTEYIYCPKCLSAIKKILLRKEKYLCSVIIPSWEKRQKLPIVAGKIGGLYSGEELNTFEYELNKKLAKVICHPLRIAVLPDSCIKDEGKIFVIMPEK